METKSVLFLPGEQAYSQIQGFDYNLMEKLKQFFTDEGIAVRDMIYEKKTHAEKISEANIQLDEMDKRGESLRLMILFMK